MAPRNFTDYVPPPTPIIFLSEEPVVFVLGYFLTVLQLEYQSPLLPTQTIISHVALLSKVLLKSRQIRSKAFPVSKKARAFLEVQGALCLLLYFFSFLITKSYQLSLTQLTFIKPFYIFILFLFLYFHVFSPSFKISSYVISNLC